MPRESLPKLDDRLTLAPNLEVSPYCLGQVASPETVLAAFDAGINFFFVTADLHWPKYEGARRGLELLFARGGGIRDRVVVAGVSYATQPEFCPFGEIVENVRGLDRLDVLVAGGAHGYELGRRLPSYLKYRAAHAFGARAIGASFHDRQAVIAPAHDGTLDVCFVRYNPCHLGAREDLFPHVAGRRAKLYNFKNTMAYVSPRRCDELGVPADVWRPDIADHFRFALSRDELDGILCILDEPAHVTALAAAIEEGPLDGDEQAHLEQLARLHFGRSEIDPS